MFNYWYLFLSILLVTSPIWIIVLGKIIGDGLYDFFQWLDKE